MVNSQEYMPPKVWEPSKENGGKFASINRPTAGAREEKNLPVGDHPLQLHSLGTPNGQKVTIMLEELLEAGVTGAEYDAYLIDISKGDQFTSGFVNINPNSKIPALVDRSQKQPIAIFESGAILLFLAEKHQMFIPQTMVEKTSMISWLFWQVGSAPYLGGGFGHFYNYAPTKQEYPIDRFAMETKRQLDVLDKQLSKNKYIAGDAYTIADMAIVPWYGNLVQGNLYDAAEFLNVRSYKNVCRWTEQLFNRPAVKRGLVVNKTWGEPGKQLRERHSSKDFKGLDL